MLIGAPDVVNMQTGWCEASHVRASKLFPVLAADATPSWKPGTILALGYGLVCRGPSVLLEAGLDQPILRLACLHCKVLSRS